jgi:heavy metal translocating P-type ATPase
VADEHTLEPSSADLQGEVGGGRLTLAFLALCLVGLAAGGIARLAGAETVGDITWAATTAMAIVPAIAVVVGDLLKRKFGVDLIAVLALAGTLAVHEYLAGAVIAVMLATGQALEARAGARAERDLHALVARAPRVVHRYEGGVLTSPSLDDVHPGDLLLVRPGEVVPVDGIVASAIAVLDESALTGEPLPVEHPEGDAVRSGAVNAGGPFDLRATTTAAEGTYAGIVRLVRQAQADSAPSVRLADRYAAYFLPIALAIAGIAWAVSGDAVRAVAVLVVATPCPLLLAVPIAVVSGMSRAARRGVVIKGGGALEQLGRGQVLLLDKTGTLTAGHPQVTDVVAPGEHTPAEVLRLAASLDQVSPHVLAAAIVRAARANDIELTLPLNVEEVHGQGIHGRVDGRTVAVGKASWVAPDDQDQPRWLTQVRRRSALDGALTVFVGIDGHLAGAVLLDDPIRPDAPRALRGLRRSGIRRILMVTGDRDEVAETVGAAIGVDQVLAERSPAEKVEAVRAAAREGVTVMVGDGINDAPALAAAAVGVAIGAHGSTASSEAADVVLTVDRLERLGDAIRIAQRARRIAVQSVVLGMGLSLVAMVAAAFGVLPPTAGALLQELIDVLAIGNALRALREPASQALKLGASESELLGRFAVEHRELAPQIGRVRDVARMVGDSRHDGTLNEVRALHRWLEDDLLPHEEGEHEELYPAFSPLLGAESVAAMGRAHGEIRHLVRRLGRLVEGIGSAGPDADDVRDLQQTLYGLYAVLRLHFAQEDEGFFALLEPAEQVISGSLGR